MQERSPEKTAFLGLGLMGAPMARRMLSVGLKLSVWNRSPSKAQAFATLGAKLAASPAEAVKNATIICLCLTDGAAVQAVLQGSDGVLGAASPGALIVDFSSLPVETTRELGGRAQASGLRWADAPVSGGPTGAEAGRLTVFRGGDTADLMQAHPILGSVASTITHLGPLGAGQAAKLCNQLIVSASLLAIAEAVAMARRLGVDPGRLPSALKGGYADSIPLQVFGPRMAGSPPPDRLGTVATMAKDVEAVGAMLETAGAASLYHTGVLEGYRRALREGLGPEDLSQIVRLFDPV